MSEFRVLLSFYPEGIGPKVKKFELLTIASKNKRHFIRIRSEKDLDKAIERAVDTSIGKLINLIKRVFFFYIFSRAHCDRHIDQ